MESSFRRFEGLGSDWLLLSGCKQFLLAFSTLFNCLIALRAQQPVTRLSGTVGGSAAGGIVLLVE